jgi:2-dehydropantoate 2-reductase
VRVLVIGAGALGGYFGACMARAARDVTFLVRPGRAEQLAQNGLRLFSPHGDFTVAATTVLASDLREPFDLVWLALRRIH